MPARTTKVSPGVWDVPNAGTRYRYRVCSSEVSTEWTIYKLKKERPLVDPEHASKDGPIWKEVQNGFRSKISAVEFVEELAAREELKDDYIFDKGGKI